MQGQNVVPNGKNSIKVEEMDIRFNGFKMEGKSGLKSATIKRSWSRLATALPLHTGYHPPSRAHDLVEQLIESHAELWPMSAEACRLSSAAITAGLTRLL